MSLVIFFKWLFDRQPNTYISLMTYERGQSILMSFSLLFCFTATGCTFIHVVFSTQQAAVQAVIFQAVFNPLYTICMLTAQLQTAGRQS